VRRAAIALASALALASGAGGEPQKAKPDLAKPDSSFVPKGRKGNWQAHVTSTPRGHMIGNPAAKGRLIAFVSYTCPQCAAFTLRGEQGINLLLLNPGTMSLEIRPRTANGLDVTVSLLAACGDPAGFKTRHQALMLAQSDWLIRAKAAPASQQAIWERAERAGRMNAGSALGLTAMLARRGQRLAELDACLADDAAAARLRANAAADTADFKLTALPPAFALDGKLLTGVSTWEALTPILSARFAETLAGE
jgi:hypothetical protein